MLNVIYTYIHLMCSHVCVCIKMAPQHSTITVSISYGNKQTKREKVSSVSHACRKYTNHKITWILCGIILMLLLFGCVCNVVYMRWIVLYQKISVYRFSIFYPLLNVTVTVCTAYGEQRWREWKREWIMSPMYIFFVILKLAQ